MNEKNTRYKNKSSNNLRYLSNVCFTMTKLIVALFFFQFGSYNKIVDQTGYDKHEQLHNVSPTYCCTWTYSIGAIEAPVYTILQRTNKFQHIHVLPTCKLTNTK